MNKYSLKIFASSAQTNLTVSLKINGKFIKIITNKNTVINLTAYLVNGQNNIELSGNYNPPNSSITVELKGENTFSQQQTGGTGIINQTFIVFLSNNAHPDE